MQLDILETKLWKTNKKWREKVLRPAEMKSKYQKRSQEYSNNNLRKEKWQSAVRFSSI